MSTRTTDDQREAARHRQEVIAAYRAWRTFLEAQQTILATERANAAIDAFEGASAQQERAEAARREIAALSPAQRALFEAVYAQERQQEQQRHDAAAQPRSGSITRVDPDEVAQAALAQLLREARGAHRSDGRGLVPRGTPDAIAWLGIDLATVESAPPSETDYQLLGRRSPKRRGVIINVVLAVLSLCLVPVVMLVGRPSQATNAPSRSPLSNGATLAPWPLIALRDGAGTWVVPVTKATTRWPQSSTDGAWLDGSIRPLEICVPSAHFAELTDLVVDSAGDAPVRQFTLTERTETTPDLLLHVCSAPDRSQPSRAGWLQAVESLVYLAPGAAAPSGLRVEQITVIGQGDEPTLASGRMTVIVTVHDPHATDWLATPSSVLLASGETALASDTIHDGERVTFHYLVAAQTEPFPLVWQVQAGDGQAVRYRTTLNSPLTRDAVLRSVLRMTELTVVPSQQTMGITLVLENIGPRPLALTPADFSVQTAAGPVAVAAPALQLTLAAGEQRTVTIDVPLQSSTVQLGPFRYALTVQE